VKDNSLAKMTVDELWVLHEKIRATLSTRLDAEMNKLQRRLAQINGHKDRSGKGAKERRPYPKVHPKYRNPERPLETWSGRGIQPRWVRAQLRAGKRFDDLLIGRAH
jgi:DNA-binding protein H-NS